LDHAKARFHYLEKSVQLIAGIVFGNLSEKFRCMLIIVFYMQFCQLLSLGRWPKRNTLSMKFLRSFRDEPFLFQLGNALRNSAFGSLIGLCNLSDGNARIKIYFSRICISIAE